MKPDFNRLPCPRCGSKRIGYLRTCMNEGAGRGLFTCRDCNLTFAGVFGDDEKDKAGLAWDAAVRGYEKETA